jgi:hypothetical protein
MSYRLLVSRTALLVLPWWIVAALAPAASGQPRGEPALRVRNLEDAGPDSWAAHRAARDRQREQAWSRPDAPRHRAHRRGEAPAIMLTGYWPPTNEMLRRFSDDPVQNPNGWIGQNWEGRGYDVYAYFPEFDPPNCSSCGKGTGDLEVDYQDTSNDFWLLADAIQPVAIITFSRGFNDLSWEVEMNQFNRAVWINDYLSPFQPTPAPPDASVPAETLRQSLLPVQEIVDAVDAAALGLDPAICFTGDGGAFLSEFIAYHGVWYQSIHEDPLDPAWCVTAGHVHVGGQIPWGIATQAARVTVRTVLDYVDSILMPPYCQPDLGLGGPGTAVLSVCGEELATGGEADLLLSGAPPSTLAFLAAGFVLDPTPFQGGQIAPVPWTLFFGVPTSTEGELSFPGLPGGNGPATLYTQFLYLDGAQTEGVGFSNVVALEFLP